MTICIAAMCVVDKERDGIVFCADRQRSSSLHGFEGNAPKYKVINKRAILLGSGELELIDEILEDEFLQSCSDKTIEEIVKDINNRIKKLIQRKIENKILSKHGLNSETYLEKSNSISELIVEKIEREKERLIGSMELEFILAGCDSNGKIKLYTLAKEEFYPHVTQSIAIIGSGTTISNLELSKEYQNSSMGVSEAILKIYKAKRAAERDFFVGNKTDLGILYPFGESGEFVAEIRSFDEGSDGLKELLDKELTKIKEQEFEGMEEIKVKLNDMFYGPAKIGPEEISEIKKIQFEFWNEFKKYAISNSIKVNLGKTYPQHWYDIRIGISEAYIALSVNTQENLIGCELYIPDSKRLFKKLEERKTEIERELGVSLAWMELKEKKASRIKLTWEFDIFAKDKWGDCFDELKLGVENFYDVFKKKWLPLAKSDISDEDEMIEKFKTEMMERVIDEEMVNGGMAENIGEDNENKVEEKNHQ